MVCRGIEGRGIMVDLLMGGRPLIYESRPCCMAVRLLVVVLWLGSVDNDDAVLVRGYGKWTVVG